MNQIHPEQGALLRMSFWWCVGSFWHNLCLLDSVLSNGGKNLICEHQVIDMMWLFPFQCWYGFIGYDIFLAFYSQVWYIMPSAFTRSKGKHVFMLH